MHHIYHTQGFVLSSKNKGEANKIFTIYTRELGLVRAVAQGIRLSKSKSRFALQDFSLAHIDFVRGKEFWRITSSASINHFPFLKRDKDSISVIFQVSKLIEKLCTGEEANEKIFDALIQILYILDSEQISSENREALELYVVFRIVYELGYVGDSEKIEEFLGDDIGQSKIENLLKEKTSIVALINRAIRESHL